MPEVVAGRKMFPLLKRLFFFCEYNQGGLPLRPENPVTLTGS